MSKRIFQTAISYATPTAMGAVPTTAQYMALRATLTLGGCDILEISVQGTSTASAVFGGLLKRASTTSTGGYTALANPNSDGPADPRANQGTTAVASGVSNVTTNPTVSSAATDTAISMTINAFGGLYRENFAPTQQPSILGTTAPYQEIVLFNCNTSPFGGAASSCNSFFIYEPY